MIPSFVAENIGFSTFRPCQEKAIAAGLFDKKNLLVCTPTASGKTLVGEMAMLHQLSLKKKSLCCSPQSIGERKNMLLSKKYGLIATTALSIGDMDGEDRFLERADIIITTAEKLDSLLRHHCSWITQVGCLIVDEVHLLNDESRGPTLEIIITLLQTLVPSLHIIALSATIGNAPVLADWLQATLIEDTWRPVELRQGIYCEGALYFQKPYKDTGK